ncbi:hypothetical protein ICW40_16025 [Actinotalea ferrariae]|uniref:helix-hairpin-helix domain-containing protein n=1 Tax=Actinotalea ferrariae TaxID=1386098 RepID=UPI001C8C37DE|nr:helix-hairpin-helix domain-containing protein [Actinotalea ferrariae]MBX9246305.1 hypothetical protein [Actinotalea ferrariae]
MTDLPNIGGPARGALEARGVDTLEQVATLSEKELLAIHGVGPKAVRILRAAAAEAGLSPREEPAGR